MNAKIVQMLHKMCFHLQKKKKKKELTNPRDE